MEAAKQLESMYYCLNLWNIYIKIRINTLIKLTDFLVHVNQEIVLEKHKTDNRKHINQN